MSEQTAVPSHIIKKFEKGFEGNGKLISAVRAGDTIGVAKIMEKFGKGSLNPIQQVAVKSWQDLCGEFNTIP